MVQRQRAVPTGPRLVLAASTAFDRAGFEGASPARIAQWAGVSGGTLTVALVRSLEESAEVGAAGCRPSRRRSTRATPCRTPATT
ncbi:MULTISPECIES: hypothetical protein [Kitasatospora]|uniref:BarB homolog n=2 Tax=Kitasatospora setae TaxID=2066 RepID=Q6L8I1_9ACTN|nr:MULTISPECIES: hypothetical protein [Kitasatospora]BAD20234.1 BarB homolog [Kitasatospora setae KM-6054]BAJ31633.1 putative TetR family transcriptional regulator [Kitasatospora setae KM-6054]